MTKTRIRTGLLGLGRLGRVYARSLSSLIPETELVAVCDTNQETLESVADEFRVDRGYTKPEDLVDDDGVEAIVICTPTTTHRDVLKLAVDARKPVFCEKPLSTSLDEAIEMKKTVEDAGVFFQMGFMRRFDRGYAAAKKRIDEGRIGKAVSFKSSSRDPFLPSLDYLSTSGGIFVDMGIHDLDLALWFFGDIERVTAVGAVLAYPEVESIGDIDNAVATLQFEDGRLGVIDLSRNGVYGYDIFTEILGTEGTIRVGYLRETPILEMTENRISHDTVPYFMERFGEAYTTQLQNFARNVLEGDRPPITLDDGVRALRVAYAATESFQKGESVAIGET